jgi:hypothetical protein
LCHAKPLSAGRPDLPIGRFFYFRQFFWKITKVAFLAAFLKIVYIGSFRQKTGWVALAAWHRVRHITEIHGFESRQGVRFLGTLYLHT